MDFPFNILAPIPVSPPESPRPQARRAAEPEAARANRGTGAVDRTAFDRLVLDHLAAAQRFAIRLTGDADRAEEVVQDALVRAARGWATYRGEAKFQTWLFGIVVNAFRDHWARRQRDASEPLPEQADRSADDPARRAAAEEFGRIVAKFVSALPPRQREVLVLSAYEQLEVGEIAGVLGISEVNVRTNLHHARERLREKLRPYVEVAKREDVKS